MTEEIPVERGIRCTECGSTVYLTRGYGRTLKARCDCVDIKVKVGTTTPEGWE